MSSDKSSDSFVISCPHCRQMLEIPVACGEQDIQCPVCQRQFLVEPADDGAIPASEVVKQAGSMSALQRAWKPMLAVSGGLLIIALAIFWWTAHRQPVSGAISAKNTAGVPSTNAVADKTTDIRVARVTDTKPVLPPAMAVVEITVERKPGTAFVSVSGQISGLGSGIKAFPRVVNLMLNTSNVLASLSVPVNGVATLAPMRLPCSLGCNAYVLSASVESPDGPMTNYTVQARDEVIMNRVHDGPADITATLQAQRASPDSDCVIVSGQLNGFATDGQAGPHVVKLALNGSNILASLSEPVGGVATIAPVRMPCVQGNNLYILRADIKTADASGDIYDVLASDSVFVALLHAGDTPIMPQIGEVYPSAELPLYATKGVAFFTRDSPFELDYYGREPGADPSNVTIVVRDARNEWMDVTSHFIRNATGIRMKPDARVPLQQAYPEIRVRVPAMGCSSTAAVSIVRYLVLDAALKNKPHFFGTKNILLTRGCCQDVTLLGMNVPDRLDSIICKGDTNSFILRAPVCTVVHACWEVPRHGRLSNDVVVVRIAPPAAGKAWFYMDDQTPAQGVEHFTIVADSPEFVDMVAQSIPRKNENLMLADLVAAGITNPAQIKIDWKAKR